MAVTCKWENPIGTCFSKYDEKKEWQIVIYGGGNCPAVFCWEDKQGYQQLHNFILEKTNLSVFDDYVDIVIFRDRAKESKFIIDMLVKKGIDFTVKATSKI